MKLNLTSRNQAGAANLFATRISGPFGPYEILDPAPAGALIARYARMIVKCRGEK